MVSDGRVFKWLDETRESGKYNMITEIARPLRIKFGLDQKQASEVWLRWAELKEREARTK